MSEENLLRQGTVDDGTNPIRPFVADPVSENAPVEDENSRIIQADSNTHNKALAEGLVLENQPSAPSQATNNMNAIEQTYKHSQSAHV